MTKLYISSLFLCAAIAAAQQGSHPAPAPVQQSVEVTTSIPPIPLSESNRAVQTIETREQPLLVPGVVDFLRQDTSLNVQARAPLGVQADLSIRGTTFEQSLILVDGLRVDDPETGHLNLDIPVPLDAVSRIEVLHGSGSTFYGSDAIGGAVNFLTARPDHMSIVARSGAGNYGSLEQHLRADYSSAGFAEELTAGRDTSDGFMADRNYSSNAAASESWFTLFGKNTTDVLLAASDRPYGANQFYGPYDSWERTKGWFAAIQQQLGERTSASFAYRRHTDLFVLLQDNPDYYRNNHITGAWQSAARRADSFGANTTLSYGLEATGDSIHSTNLGVHARNQGAGYANLSLRSLGRLSLSIGAREQVFSGGDSVFSPSIAAAYAMTSTLRARASVGHGYRLPTYLDLYYSDPTTIGNPNLKPESSWSYEGGIDWSPSRAPFTLTATGFSLHQKNGIDYSKFDLSRPWQATNVANFAYNGAEADLRVHLPRSQRLQLSYTAVQATSPPHGLISEYAFNYAAQSALLAWSADLPAQISARTQLAVIQKTTQSPYALWDVALARNSGRVRPYLRLLNLSNTSYQEIPGVPLQGRTIMGGAEVNWSAQHR
ncbi:TonB-dependent receptor plug domain-containing protein [Edaphobacter bradus]|uniref:TonB-dependent receptor plug domain-containing protein n=1 Tax=Edaphobacter bradus TaxID=2259016 RepID=UPI0021E0B072|nr:TonB-dependent receptor [Edaphobacter bradus]